MSDDHRRSPQGAADDTKRWHHLIPTPAPAGGNGMLARLPPQISEALRPRLVPLVQGQVVHAADAPVEAAYFPLSGLVSVIGRLEDGTQAEVGMIGAEGMTGATLAWGTGTVFADHAVQLPGTALRVEAAALREAAAAHPVLRDVVARHAEAMLAQAVQAALCNARHSVRQRLARWLLAAHDRAGGDEMPLTQDFLAAMLAVHRPNVTTAAGALRGTGAIRYRAGRVTVLDRRALEGCACECYGTTRRRCDALLGSPGVHESRY